VLRLIFLAALVALAGCSIAPFRTGTRTPPEPAAASTRPGSAGSGPVLTAPTDIQRPAPEEAIDAPAPVQMPKERPKVTQASLSPASRALVSQAQTQRRNGDLPGATVSLERALRIEPNNPLLWIEMGRLRMDQRNYPQAENMGRKALAMSVGDDKTQAAAWQLVGDSLKARGKNPEAQAAYDKSRALGPR
jgi:tetratricopeptide (TPR) repeat protein